MLHLRVVCPREHSDEVVRLLDGHAGVAHLVRLPDAVLRPAGDLIEADVARESADDVLALLCDLGVDHSGGITLENIDTAMSDAADAAEERAPGEGADAVVWEELISRTGEESRLTATYVAFVTLACMLAAVGVVTDSPVTIVGAMVVGPEFGPLAAIAVGLVGKRWDLVRRALLALVAGFAFAMAVTGVCAWLGERFGLFTIEKVMHAAQVDFIYRVGPFSLIVALLAGAAGMLSMTSAKSAALVGVFISVTTIPAVGYAVIAAVTGQWGRFGGSLGQLAVNLLGIVVAATAVLLLRKRRRAAMTRPLSKG
ncbi:DUF389 domain-containing protein [Sciscionella sediminilitoris]|uniref:DUF389 domain-containing protein n=1 Tax=Sciscionella sediminilitoris TaxID=1445613 RepID=UPI0004DEE4BE|nr:DUF389 domain-containing protein [Sciscionella sp. SE31]